MISKKRGHLSRLVATLDRINMGVIADCGGDFHLKKLLNAHRKKCIEIVRSEANDKLDQYHDLKIEYNELRENLDALIRATDRVIEHVIIAEDPKIDEALQQSVLEEESPYEDTLEFIQQRLI